MFHSVQVPVAPAALIAVLACRVFGLDQSGADNLATYIASNTPHQRGVCAVPHCGDGMLAVSLLSKTGMIVHATDSNQNVNVLPAFQTQQAMTCTGTRFYYGCGTLDRLPYPDRFVDLLAIVGLTDGGLSSLSISEVKRVLCPGGKAWIGRGAAEGGGITAAALQAWCNGQSNTVVTTDAQGIFAVVTGQELSGIDEWTHREHDPGNSLSSNDTRLQWPYLPQSWVKPYGIWRRGCMVSQGGRVYYAVNYYCDGNPAFRWLKAYRVYNGQTLWTRDLNADWPGDIGPFEYNDPVSSSCIVAQNDKLYLMKQASVLVLDGETGRQTDSIILGDAGNYVKWIAIDTTRLYALLGSTSLTGSSGRTLVSYSLNSKTMLWRQTFADDTIDVRDIGVANGNIYFYSNATTARLACYSGATGAMQWQSTKPFGGTERQKWTLGYLNRFDCTPYGIIGESGDTLYCYPLGGGAPWSRSESSTHRFVRDSLLFANFSPNPINIRTNKIDTRYSIANWGGGCGPASSSHDGIYGQVGGIAYGFSSATNFDSQPFKSDCGSTPVITNGLLLKLPTACTCASMFRGLMTEASAGGFDFNQSATSSRLVTGPKFGAVQKTVTPDNLDWATHRGSNGRSGFLNVNVPSAVGLAWTYTPAVPYDDLTEFLKTIDSMDNMSTPAVTVDDHVFFGGTDGAIRCIRDGALVWSYTTGGPIYATPTAYDGCVFAGSGDGSVYCLEAVSGSLVWKFRAAPAERMINLYGHLASTWPVMTGVLCANNVAYLAAGFHDKYGVYVYALNTGDGSIVWQNSTISGCYNAAQRVGVAPGGYMTIKGNKLFIRGYHGDNAVLDVATGAQVTLGGTYATINYEGTRGRDIGLVDSTHLFIGGRPIFADHRERGSFLGCLTSNILKLDGSAVPQYPSVAELSSEAVTPAWDGSSWFTAVDGMTHLERWPLAGMLSAVDATQQANPIQSSTSPRRIVDAPADVTVQTPLATWRRSNYDINAIIAAGNAVITAACVHGRFDAKDTWQWFLAVLDKSDGSVIDSVHLPTEPLHQGLALTRYGNIIVSFKNGSVRSYGSPVSVASRWPVMPAAAAAPAMPLTTTNVWAASPSQASSHAEAAGSGPGTVRVMPAPSPATPVMVSLVNSSGARVSGGLLGVKDSVALTAANGNRPPALSCRQVAYQPRDMRWHPERECLPIASVKATSSAPSTRPSKTIDRDLTSRWTPLAAGPQSITYDLGRAQEVAAVSVVWYAARPSRTSFAIEVSTDDRRFGKVDEGTFAGRGTNTTLRSFMPVNTRYVRISMDAPVSLYEVGIHREAEADAAMSFK